MDLLFVLVAVIALWASGLVLAITLCVTAARTDRSNESGRWLAPARG